MTAKHSADIEAVEREHEGYVPADSGDDAEGKFMVVTHGTIDQFKLLQMLTKSCLWKQV